MNDEREHINILKREIADMNLPEVNSSQEHTAQIEVLIVILYVHSIEFFTT